MYSVAILSQTSSCLHRSQTHVFEEGLGDDHCVALSIPRNMLWGETCHLNSFSGDFTLHSARCSPKIGPWCSVSVVLFWGEMSGLCALYAPSMRPLCALYAPIMRPLCAHYAPTMRSVCAHYAPSMRPRGPELHRGIANGHRLWVKRGKMAGNMATWPPEVREVLGPKGKVLQVHTSGWWTHKKTFVARCVLKKDQETNWETGCKTAASTLAAGQLATTHHSTAAGKKMLSFCAHLNVVAFWGGGGGMSWRRYSR